MPDDTRLTVCLVLVVGMLAAGIAPVSAGAAWQDAGGDPPRDSAAVDDTAAVASGVSAPETSARNAVPYETDRSVAYHVLAAPAYVLHAVTRPIGWGVRYAEREFPSLFLPRHPPRGVLPIVELGGPAGVMGGLALYDNHVFGSDHRVRLEGLYGSSDTFEADVSYRIPRVLGRHSLLAVTADVFSDPNDQFFVGGNGSTREADRTTFLRDQFAASTTLTVEPSRRLGLRATARYEHADVRARSESAEDRLLSAGLAGLRTTDLLTTRLEARLSNLRGGRRPYAGTEVQVRLDYTHDLDTDRFRYGRYVAEVRQYLPIAVLPNTRRLALRAQLEQVAPLLGGDAVPFYHLPRLGGSFGLRGFRYGRYRDDGSLLLSAEYRYPIWNQFDAAVLVDAGQVFDGLADVTVDRFHWSYGGGIYMLNQRGVAFRFELAYSKEGVRSILTVRPAFSRWPR